MDILKEYILQCEKAKEIQKAWKPKVGDNFCMQGNLRVTTTINIVTVVTKSLNNQSICVRGINGYALDISLAVFIPSQAQLQGMLHKTFQGVYALGKCAYLFNGIKKNREYYGIFKSMEQLWLAFVMKEKYNKIWNGEEWKKL